MGPGEWSLLLLALPAGWLVSRFNPAIAYRRGVLIGLMLAAILGIGVALSIGFIGRPNPRPSGLFPMTDQ